MLRRVFAESLDRLVIRAACMGLESEPVKARADEALQILSRRPFFPPSVPPVEVSCGHDGRFSFPSPHPLGPPVTHTAYGRVLPASGPGKREDRSGARPVVILLHGWNGQLAYRYLFPLLARGLNRRGMDAVLLELPYHMHRKPPGARGATDFLSPELPRLLHAILQAVADIRTVGAWQKTGGAPWVGLWGNSLGAWLGGLALANDPVFSGAALVTPVGELESAVRQLPFCAHLRASLRSVDNLDLSPLDLPAQKPQCARESVLLVEGEYDQFFDTDGVEKLYHAWDHPPIRRCRHGHLSVLLSQRVMVETLDFLARAAGR